MKHPNILTFKDSQETEEKGETVIYLVTEAVTPLIDVLQSLNFTLEARYATCLLAFSMRINMEAQSRY